MKCHLKLHIDITLRYITCRVRVQRSIVTGGRCKRPPPPRPPGTDCLVVVSRLLSSCREFAAASRHHDDPPRGDTRTWARLRSRVLPCVPRPVPANPALHDGVLGRMHARRQKRSMRSSKIKKVRGRGTHFNAFVRQPPNYFFEGGGNSRCLKVKCYAVHNA